MVKVEGEYVDSRKTGKTVQDVYDRQLELMEDQHEEHIMEFKLKHAEDRKALKVQYEVYLKEQEAIKAEKKRLEADRKEAEAAAEEAKYKRKKAKA